jgi:SAM-dependent methyltransferase
MTEHPTPNVTDQLTALRADLRNANYTIDRTTQLLGDLANDALHREQAVPATRVLIGSTDPAAYLMRLFMLGHTLTEAEITAAFPTLGLAGAYAMNLVTQEGPGIRALTEIRPHAFSDESGQTDWWLASDLGEVATGGALAADHVLGVGGASLTLAQFTSRTKVGRVLDLGTGCGIQALHASTHADTIVATDISRRALDYARFNAALNEVSCDLRLGSMLEPVADEHFDLVVSNPPFVITPRTGNDSTLPQYEYRDGGRSGDDLVHDLIVQIGSVLAPGGVAHLLGNWEIRGEADWTERVIQWLDEAEAAHGPLDAWIVQRELLDPAQYAETWIRDGGTTQDRDPEAYAATYSAWLDDFASRNVQGIGFGMIWLRKPASGERTLRRLEEITGTVQQPLGPVVARSIAAHDWHTALSDDELCAQYLTHAEDVTEERYYVPGSQDPNVIIIRKGGGYGRAVQATTVLAGLVGACDGELTIGQITGAIATLFEVDEIDLRAEVLPDVRGLVTDGLLVPVK